MSSSKEKEKQHILTKSTSGCKSIMSYFALASKVPRFCGTDEGLVPTPEANVPGRPSTSTASCSSPSADVPNLRGVALESTTEAEVNDAGGTINSTSYNTPGSVWYKSMKLDVEWLKTNHECLKVYMDGPQGTQNFAFFSETQSEL
jgi:hypothetical protein